MVWNNFDFKQVYIPFIEQKWTQWIYRYMNCTAREIRLVPLGGKAKCTSVSELAQSQVLL